MNRASKIISISLITFMLVGVSSVSAASPSQMGVFSTDSSQMLSSVSTFAGLGSAGVLNADVNASLFLAPKSVLVLDDGSVIVADTNNQLLRKISAGQVTTFAGASVNKDAKGFPIGGLLDGVSDQSFFNHPDGLAKDAKGDIFIADTDNNAIREIDTAGNVTTIAGNGVPGIADGQGSAALFNAPDDVAVAKDGTIYVADTLNSLIRKISPDGAVTTLNAPSTRTIVLASGETIHTGDFQDGPLSQAKFNEPSGLAIDSTGNLYVSDSGNQRIRYINISKGLVSTVAGNSVSSTDATSVYEAQAIYAAGDFADGVANQAMFNFPMGIALTKEGGLVIADSQNNSIRYLFHGHVSTLAGDIDLFSGTADGIERTAQFNLPMDVAVTAEGSILVADSFNNKIRIIKPFHLPADLPQNNSINVVLDNQTVVFDAKPEITSGRTMVPVQSIAEALGYQVTYTAMNQMIQLQRGSVVIDMTLGNKTIVTKQTGQTDITAAIDVAPYISKSGRTLIPVRFFAEQIGLDVQWDQTANTVILRNKL